MVPEEFRKLLDATIGDGDSNGSVDVNLWTRLKARNQGGSHMSNGNGLIGKIWAGRKMV